MRPLPAEASARSAEALAYREGMTEDTPDRPAPVAEDWGDFDLTAPSTDETDRGWGEQPDDDEEWLRRQIPPHHGG